MKDTRSFFEKLTGVVKMDDDMQDDDMEDAPSVSRMSNLQSSLGRRIQNREENPVSESDHWGEEEPEEGQLTVDVYQTPSEIIIKTMVAGVRPEDLDISITRDMVVIKGKRETERMVKEEDYFHQELYWGTFSRTIMLPAEIEVEESEAVEKHGLLIIRMPKIDKHKQTRLKVKG